MDYYSCLVLDYFYNQLGRARESWQSGNGLPVFYPDIYPDIVSWLTNVTEIEIVTIVNLLRLYLWTRYLRNRVMPNIEMVSILPFFLPFWHMAERTGLEPATSAVTGQRSNQLSYHSVGILDGIRTRDCSVKGNGDDRFTTRTFPLDIIHLYRLESRIIYMKASRS